MGRYRSVENDTVAYELGTCEGPRSRLEGVEWETNKILSQNPAYVPRSKPQTKTPEGK
jgi:hypothetical protein